MAISSDGVVIILYGSDDTPIANTVTVTAIIPPISSPL